MLRRIIEVTSAIEQLLKRSGRKKWEVDISITPVQTFSQMNKQQQAEAVFAELDICQDGWITKGELELVDVVVVVDVIADVIVVVCTLMGWLDYQR